MQIADALYNRLQYQLAASASVHLDDSHAAGLCAGATRAGSFNVRTLSTNFSFPLRANLSGHVDAGYTFGDRIDKVAVAGSGLAWMVGSRVQLDLLVPTGRLSADVAVDPTLYPIPVLSEQRSSVTRTYLSRTSACQRPYVVWPNDDLYQTCATFISFISAPSTQNSKRCEKVREVPGDKGRTGYRSESASPSVQRIARDTCCTVISYIEKLIGGIHRH
jgi:hypothetical protein